MLRAGVASLAVVACAAAGVLLPAAPGQTPVTEPVAESVVDAGRTGDADAPPRRPRKPLAGRVVVLDPGHQLGNARFPREINRLVPAGGFSKACNTTGTATNAGLPEATLNFRVAKLVRKRLRGLGARVVLTRTTNRYDRWGPCVDRRGRAGNRIDADLKVSIHADGSYARGARGFHVIAPTNRRGWTRDIHRPSRRLAKAMKSGLRARGIPVANYIAGGDGLDFRGDLGTLNLSDVPTVMVELGNMRSPADVRRMTTKRGRTSYAKGLVRGIRTFLR